MKIEQLLQLQTLAFPLISMVGGPDIPGEFIKPGAKYLHYGANVLREAADVLEVAGTALDDGRVTMTEIEAVFAEYTELKDVAGAIKLLNAPE